MSDHLAARVEDDAVAVEDQLVLAADGVDVGDVGTVVDGAPAHHLLTRAPLALVIRRAVDVDEQLDAVLRLPCHGSGWIPAVLADRDADADPRLLEDRAPVSDREVTLLIENPVVGQEDLVVYALHHSVADECGGVEDGAVLVDEADDS